jgi:beta-xylosidase
MNNFVRLLLVISLGLVLRACGQDVPSAGRSAVGPDTSSCTFSNPIADGADPWVVRHGDWYYLVESTGGGISVYRST